MRLVGFYIFLYVCLSTVWELVDSDVEKSDEGMEYCGI